ncbi:MAG TPA: HTTM domain-containing protein [Polyangiaceae bacterium]|jgi:hypothetical protein
MRNPLVRLAAWLDAPQPVLRLEIIRVFAPLAVLGFMSGRLVHADEWLGDAGFRVPDLGGDVRQPLYVPALPSSVAWGVVTVMVIAGLLCALGVRARATALLFAVTLAFVGLSDRLAAFTVSKISPVIMLAVALGPAGSLVGVDAWRRRRRGEPQPPAVQRFGSLRFLQLMLVVFYCASGLAKAGGDWLVVPKVLFSHLHDSYQTAISFFLASTLPSWVWTPLQGSVLAFEALAPLWFGLRWTRTYALLFGLGMHLGIGLMFGPVVWFALLMMTLLVGCFLPDRWLAGAARALRITGG